MCALQLTRPKEKIIDDKSVGGSLFVEDSSGKQRIAGSPQFASIIFFYEQIIVFPFLNTQIRLHCLFMVPSGVKGHWLPFVSGDPTQL